MFRKILLWSFLFSLAGSLGHAQQRGPTPPTRSSGYSISGQILTDATRSEGRRPVSLERDGMPVDTVFTDTSGRFEFRDLPPGGYEIIVDHEGYEPERQRVNFLPSSRSAIILIPLRSKPPADTPREATTPVDVTELDGSISREAVEELKKAEEETRKGNTGNAVERLEAALKIAPNFYRAHVALGRAYHNLKRYRDAEQHFQAARTLNPRSAAPLLNLGDLYIQEAGARTQEGIVVHAELLNQAITVLQDAVRLEPDSSMAHYLLGNATYRFALYEEAETHLKRALEIDGMAAARLMLANLYARLEKWDEALVQLDAYLAENPKAANRAEVEQVRAKLEANRGRGRE
jgi:Flp pilus assembly protein TadD